MRLPALVFLLAAPALAQSAVTPPLPYQDTTLPPEQRAADLVHRMSLDEKVGQMGSAAHAIPRLGVPAYNYWNEALHGVARAGYATMFPQALGMAATWDAPLLHQIGDVISTEARAKNAEALRHNIHDIYFGLTFWSPNINIFRDPRWGRGQETYGEDPFLTGTLGANFIRGIQGDDPHYLKLVATPKHFAVHSGPESLRHKFNVEPTPHDLWDTYLPQFRMAIVDAHADSIMCAYNAVDGAPACASKNLLENVLRHDWNFKGFVTSDCGAIDDIFRPNGHHTAPDPAHADRDALLAGTDTNCGATYEHLGEAVHQGLLHESDIDTSLVRLFTARMRLGLFDPPAQVPFAQIPFSAVHSPANAALARRTANESMVLLKNDGILPLSASKTRKIAVIGPNAAMLVSLQGNYNGTPVDPAFPVDAIARALPAAHVLYAPGAPFVDGFLLPVPRTLLHPSADSAVQGLKAEYFAATSLDGKPTHSSIDPQINFNWDGVNPLPGHPATGFAVRWSGTISMPAPGDYNFLLRAGNCRRCAYEQSFKVLLDGKPVASADALPDEPPSSAPVRLNGTTGLPEEAHRQGPQKFSAHFADATPHTLEVQFIRHSAEHGSGISLEFQPTPGLLLPAALEAAKQADVVVAMLGLTPTLEGEEMSVNLPGFQGGDRTDIALPAAQQHLLEALASTGKPLVTVLLNGSALAVNFAQQHANAVLEAWYPGEAGGQAIADTLTGANNPSGRLPVTFYKSVADLPAFTDYAMRGRTYRYFSGTPLYSFGFGLSYTHFTYSNLKLSASSLRAGDSLIAEADIRNTGKRAGDEVAELFLAPPASPLNPKLQLQGFQRIHLAPGKTRHVVFTLSPRQLSLVDATGSRSVQPGAYTVSIGGAQPGDAQASTPSMSAPFTITGSLVLPR